MLEIIFIFSTAVVTLVFIMLVMSLFSKQPGQQVRARMEQYLVESEMAAQEQAVDDLAETGSQSSQLVDVENEWLIERRGGSGGIKKLLANVGTIITPKTLAAKIAKELATADVPLKANEFVAIQFVAVTLSFTVGMVLTQSLFLGLVLAFTGYFIPKIWVKVLKAKRIAMFNDQILDALMMVANGLKAGYSFLQALEMVSREAPAPMSVELKRVLKENSLGLNLEDSLIALNNRIESADWDLVTTVVLIQRQVGGNLAEILEKICHTIRERMRIKGDIQTKTAQAKVSGALVGILPIVLGILIYFINPEFMTMLFTFSHGAFRGWYVVVFGVFWEMIGMYAIMKIVDIEV